MEKKCSSLKEAIDITFNKYKYEKNEENYLKILDYLLAGQYSYITSEKGAREYAMNRNNVINDINYYYDEAKLGQERSLLNDENVGLSIKAEVVAKYFTHLSKASSKVTFGTLAGKIDKIDNKGEYLKGILASGENNLLLTSSEVKRLVIENAYRLLRIHMNRAGNPVLDLYSDNDVLVSEREAIARNINEYLNQTFYGINSYNLVEFINNLDGETINYMCDLYSFTRRNQQNVFRINQADTMNADKDSIELFNAFSDIELIKKLENNGISY